MCQDLLLLVGSNPLPNYLVTMILKPATLRLFFTPQTEQVKDRLKRILQKSDHVPEIVELSVKSAADVQEIRQLCATLPWGERLCVNYTGGTKAMAAAVRAFCKDDSRASYLDDRLGELTYDNGISKSLSGMNLRVDLGTILGLHGVSQLPSKRFENGPTEHETTELVRRVLTDPSLAARAYEQLKMSKLQNPLDCDIVKELLPGRMGTDPGTASNKKEWCKFLKGGWLEEWACGVVNALLAGTGDTALAGVNCRRDTGRDFEMDVVVMRGHRLHVISCTTDTSLGMCKSKLFEVMLRARHMGGDLARCALVCLLHGSDSKGAYSDQLRWDAADVWDSASRPAVFCLDELREWFGFDTGVPSCGTLKAWLDSEKEAS